LPRTANELGDASTWRLSGETFELAHRPAGEISRAKRRLRRVRKNVKTGERLVEVIGCFLTRESRGRWHALAEDPGRAPSFLQLEKIASHIAQVVGDESLGLLVEKACARVYSHHDRVIAASREQIQRRIDHALMPRRRPLEGRPPRAPRRPRTLPPVLTRSRRPSRRTPRSRSVSRLRRARAPGRSSSDDPEPGLVRACQGGGRAGVPGGRR
jgi:hypothetical protein